MAAAYARQSCLRSWIDNICSARSVNSPFRRGVAHTTSSGLPPPRLDYRRISENIVEKVQNAQNRKAPIPSDTIHSLPRAYKEHKRITALLNTKRNARSAVGERIRRSVKDADPEVKQAALDEALKLKEEVSKLDEALASVEQDLQALALVIPNDTHPNSPLGPETAAIVKALHEPTSPLLPPDPKRDHMTLSRQLDLVDLESASIVTGSSWYYLKNEAALLEMALINYSLSIALRHGFTPITTPDVVRSDIASRCGFHPRDHSDPPVSQMYHIKPHLEGSMSPELVLAGTSEIPLAGLFANKIYPSASLPLRVVGVGHSFRAEAGARGADTRGLYRVHQFTKVELFAVTTEEGSASMMEEMEQIQQKILLGLEIPFRVLEMPSEELGASAYRKYDMEAWMPGRGSWGELSSLSNCTDYQARRMHIRYRPTPAKGHSESSTGLTFAHTLNGTAAAIPRLIIALLENGARFDEDGNLVGIELPSAVKPFWVGGELKNKFHWRS